MHKIHFDKQQEKVSSKPVVTRNCSESDNRILFCFQHITKKKQYNIENTKDKSVYRDFYKLISRLSLSTWNDLQKKGKDNGGYEVLDYSTLKYSISDNTNSLGQTITDDTKLFVFRFGGKKYRLLGYKSSTCVPTLYILGFDLDLTLYDH